MRRVLTVISNRPDYRSLCQLTSPHLESAQDHFLSLLLQLADAAHACVASLQLESDLLFRLPIYSPNASSMPHILSDLSK